MPYRQMIHRFVFLLIAFGLISCGAEEGKSSVGMDGLHSSASSEAAVAEGTVDRLGYVLPLDVKRPKPPRRPPERPDPREIREQRRSSSSFLGTVEVRLGPDEGHTQNETSLDISGDTLVAGWNQFADSSLFMGVGRSTDRGRSWSHQIFGDHTTMSDPVVKSGGSGRWYYAYIAVGGAFGNDYEVFVRRSLDDGATWQSPVNATNNSSFDDKPYMAVRGDEVLIAWADFGFSPSKPSAVRSLDGGQTFNSPTVIAVNAGNGNGACPVIGPDGTYYVFWRDSFQQFMWMARSTDQGATWEGDVAVQAMSPLPSTLPGQSFRIVNLPSVAADPVSGDLVMVWNDQAFGNPDILAVRSTDNGDTWSDPVVVNDDASAAVQFFPWVTINENGLVSVVWYDMRNDSSKIDVYLAHSSDGGASFGPNQRVTAESFTPILPWEGSAADFIGDYNAVTSDGTEVFPFYQDARSGIQDVYVAALPLGLIFADGFESGDLSAWSTSP